MLISSRTKRHAGSMKSRCAPRDCLAADSVVSSSRSLLPGEGSSNLGCQRVHPPAGPAQRRRVCGCAAGDARRMKRGPERGNRGSREREQERGERREDIRRVRNNGNRTQFFQTAPTDKGRGFAKTAVKSRTTRHKDKKGFQSMQNTRMDGGQPYQNRNQTWKSATGRGPKPIS